MAKIKTGSPPIGGRLARIETGCLHETARKNPHHWRSHGTPETVRVFRRLQEATRCHILAEHVQPVQKYFLKLCNDERYSILLGDDTFLACKCSSAAIKKYAHTHLEEQKDKKKKKKRSKSPQSRSVRSRSS